MPVKYILAFIVTREYTHN